jgi:magnesium chelatase family protein
MLVTVSSAALRGITGLPVQVEVHITAAGLPGFTVIGSPDATCRETRDRVRAALLNSGFTWPAGRVTVNLAPSGLAKTGAALDLPIALGVLAADDQLSPDLLTGMAFIGELGLDGAIRSTRGVLPLVDTFDFASTLVVVPPDNHAEACATHNPHLRTAPTLAALVANLRHQTPWATPEAEPSTPPNQPPAGLAPDLAEVHADPLTVLALEVAAAGRHPLLFVGPAGTGATLLARLTAALAPRLNFGELSDVTRIRSAAGLPFTPTDTRPPFRAPHHSASLLAVIGGAGPTASPGELSLAHAGALFLDDLPEYPASTLDAIAHALDRGTIRVTRGTTVDLPAQVQLIAAMAPCPGTHPDGPCTCSDAALARYRRRIPALLLDRLAVRVRLQPPARLPLAAHDTATAARRVAQARTRLQSGIAPALTDDAARLLDHHHHHQAGTLSARGRLDVIALAHTITALNTTDYRPHTIDADAITLALAFRPNVDQILTRPN